MTPAPKSSDAVLLATIIATTILVLGAMTLVWAEHAPELVIPILAGVIPSTFTAFIAIARGERINAKVDRNTTNIHEVTKKINGQMTALATQAGVDPEIVGLLNTPGNPLPPEKTVK